MWTGLRCARAVLMLDITAAFTGALFHLSHRLYTAAAAASNQNVCSETHVSTVSKVFLRKSNAAADYQTLIRTRGAHDYVSTSERWDGQQKSESGTKRAFWRVWVQDEAQSWRRRIQKDGLKRSIELDQSSKSLWWYDDTESVSAERCFHPDDALSREGWSQHDDAESVTSARLPEPELQLESWIREERGNVLLLQDEDATQQKTSWGVAANKFKMRSFFKLHHVSVLYAE